MIERGLFRKRLSISDDEFIPAFDRLPIPEAAGLANPGRPLHDVDRQPLEFIAKARRSFVIGLSDLRMNDGWKNAQQQSRLPQKMSVSHGCTPH